jgi:hypothetical protein
MKNVLIFSMFIFWVFWSCPSVPGRKAATKAVPPSAPTVLTANTNIHFTGKYCNVCHERIPVKGGDPYLKYNGDYQQLCGGCHHGMSPGYCHPLDIDSKLDQRLPVPADFPLRDGKFTCETCHDMYRQCVKRLFDRYTLRGAPYPRKTDFCYRCHDKTKYRELNAHHQIEADGALDIKMCLYCHKKKPNEATATYKEVTFIGNMSALCRRCHPIEGNHPDNFDHMAAPPSAKMLKRMRAMEAKYGIILPLTREGKMTCITCHNPHQKGVIAADKPSAKGAGSKYRERLPGILCIKCHQM